MILSSIAICTSAVMLVHGIVTKRILLGNFSITGYQQGAVIASLFALLIYAAVLSRFMFVEFEKTQSTEIVYLILFTLAVLSDTVRLAVPFFGLWQAASSAVNAIGRTLLFGRTLAPLSLIFAAAFSDARERTNTNRNFVILLALSIALSVIIPVNTAVIEQNFAPRWGEGHVVSEVMTVMLLTAIVSFFISAHLQGLSLRCPIFVALLSIGYAILCNALSYFAAVIGAAALFCGTALYLIELHKQYLWK